MKKITIIIAILALSVSVIAQNKKAGKSTGFSPLGFKASKTVDTLVPTPFVTTGCDSLRRYGALDNNGAYQGYMTGTNGFGDLEKAEKFYNTSAIQITGILGAVWTNTPAGTGNTKMKVYSVNATTKGPQNLLGTTSAVATNAIDITKLTYYSFTTPLAVTNAFFASFVIDQAPDTTVVLSSKEGCWSNDSLAWELWSPSPGTWYSMYQAWGGSELDLAIFPVVNTAASIENDYFTNGIKLGQNQPNPASINTTVKYEIQTGGKVSLDVYDVTGKLVCTVDQGYQNAGRHDVLIDASKLLKGTYFYSLKVDDNRLTKKMIVTE